ncbi:unnamed protein product [Owenia fusiformis]|uniref:Uncharacterized protein n=1 Tax=Owenia fusiformis TaxID=6347 RepID=A0A8J1U9A3_OWEFU|nr:unnamed protein product [Owenia fusiformis]
MDSTSAFSTLRPICVTLSQEHTRENVKELNEKLEELDQKSLQSLQEYVLFPLRFILKQSKNTSTEFYCDVLNCMNTIFSRTTMHNWELFQGLFNTFCILVSPPPNQKKKVEEIPEELKHATVKCMRTLIKQAPDSIIEKVYAVPFLPPMGHAVSLLLDLIEKEKLRQLRTDAMDALLELAQCNKKVCPTMVISVGNIFASFLPGISLAIYRVTMGDTKQGQNVTLNAIHCWTKIVCLVMGDKMLNAAEQKNTKSSGQSSHHSESNKLAVTRCKRWSEDTAHKLNILVQNIATLVGHSSWKVRMALVDWAEALITKCNKSMEASIPHLLQVLVGLVGDDYPNVASKATQALQQFSNAHMANNQSKSLVEILEENLHALATSLPRVIRTMDDNKKISTLQLFSGYLNLLGPRIKGLILSYPHLKRLSLALVQTLELDITDIKIVEDRTSASTEAAMGYMSSQPEIIRPKKYFKEFTDERIHKELQLICRLLGYYGDINVLTDHFLDVFTETSLHRKQSILILNELMLGTTGEGLNLNSTPGATTCSDSPQHLKHSKETIAVIIRSLVETYLSAAYWNIPVSNAEAIRGMQQQANPWQLNQSGRLKKNLHSIETLNSNIMQLCLMLEGFGIFAKVLGGDFEVMLQYILYPTLEKLGEESALLSDTAYITLCDITKHGKYSSINDLLCKNADFIVSSISLRLRHLGRNPNTPLVLKVLLKYTGKEIIHYIDDTIREILQSLDDNHQDECEIFMKVLHSLVCAVQRWYPPQTNSSEHGRISDTSRTVKHLSVEDVKTFLLEYKTQKRIAEGDFTDETVMGDDDVGDDDKDNVEEEMDPTEGDTEKKVPQHIKAVLEVLTRCIHILSTGNPRLRLQVLDVIENGCLAMANHKDDLLPMVHKLWPAILQRFKDDETLVTVRALKMLQIMTEISGDFMRRRIVKDILPRLMDFLKKQALISAKAGQTYKFTSVCKLQLAILQTMGDMAKQINLHENEIEFDHVLTAFLPYLHSVQPQVLQKAATKMFLEMSYVDPDAVWLKLQTVNFNLDLRPPHPTFIDLQGVKWKVKTEDYKDNVDTILAAMDSWLVH